MRDALFGDLFYTADDWDLGKQRVGLLWDWFLSVGAPSEYQAAVKAIKLEHDVLVGKYEATDSGELFTRGPEFWGPMKLLGEKADKLSAEVSKAVGVAAVPAAGSASIGETVSDAVKGVTVIGVVVLAIWMFQSVVKK